ncbi:MAG: NFACT RNA binding domain-containing protein [Polyangiales bacterium]|nr:DUF814 domain-containing protein [Myxococcales bacterium]MCB9657310.1 DUF814 domain-containing protein [Sandaracinaceae bacterium]
MSSLGRVVRVDRPSPGLIALSLHAAHGDEVLVLGPRATAFGVGLVPRRPRGAAADAFTQGLRRRLTGASVSRVDALGGVLCVTLVGSTVPDASAPVRTRAFLMAERRSGGLWLVVDERVVLTTHPAAPCPAGPHEDDDSRVSRAELVTQGDTLVRAVTGELIEGARRTLAQSLQKSLKRLTRKRDAILADAERGARAGALRAEADLWLAHGAQLKRDPHGGGAIDVLDFHADPPRPRRLTLRHDETPASRAAQLYKQARRMQRGAQVAEERWAMTEAQLDRVRELYAMAGSAETHDEVERVAGEAIALGVRELDDALDDRTRGHRRQAEASRRGGGRLPYRRFESTTGQPIWVGRSARDNDELTLRHAKPHYLWLHVEGRSGSHVVVPLGRGAVASSELLIDAATLAAHFSGATDERVVEVMHAERRYVVKPRGYAPGAVRVDRHKTLVLRREPARLAALLAREARI